jgi:diaminohydroxyphosphoribosylaminopyrimidine deaminase/5-amino-6-(5-phosphoribosylamino)uracil reductase
VSAVEDPNPGVAGRGHARLRAAGLAVDVGVGAEQAHRLHAGHFLRMREKRPHVLLKLAVSADGKVAGAGRRPIRITGARAGERVHMMRAQADAIMIGIGTALADDPLLTCRLPGLERRSPLRVVLDRALRLPPTSRLAATAHDVPLLVFAGAEADSEREAALAFCGVEVLRPHPASAASLADVLERLAERGIGNLLVEGGPQVAAALVQADLVDAAAIFRSPKVVGSDGIDALSGMPLIALADVLSRCSNETIGPDTLEMVERRRPVWPV